MGSVKREKPKRGVGRPPIALDEPLVNVTVRVRESQRDKWKRIGGAPRFRKWLDQVGDKP